MADERLGPATIKMSGRKVEAFKDKDGNIYFKHQPLGKINKIKMYGYTLELDKKDSRQRTKLSSSRDGVWRI